MNNVFLKRLHNENHEKELYGSVCITNIGIKNRVLLILHHKSINVVEFYIISKSLSYKLNAGDEPMRYYEYTSIQL